MGLAWKSPADGRGNSRTLLHPRLASNLAGVIVLSAGIARGQILSVPAATAETAPAAAAPAAAGSVFYEDWSPAADGAEADAAEEGLPEAAPTSTSIALPGLPRTCNLDAATTARHVAVDASRAYYVAVNCSGSGRVLASTDAGLSWGAPVTVATAVRQIAIEGGTVPGSVLVGWFDTSSRFQVRASLDFGTTWTAPFVVASKVLGDRGMSLVAIGSSFHAAVATSTGATLRTSPDRGLTWGPALAVAQPWTFGDLTVDAATGDLFLASDLPEFHLRRSVDGGASFGPVRRPRGAMYFTDWHLGGRGVLYVVSPDGMMALDPLTLAILPISGLSVYTELQGSVHADADGNANVATGTKPIRLYRLPAGAAALLPPQVLAPSGKHPSVVSCGTDAALVVYTDSIGQVQFHKACYGKDPLRCCEDGSGNTGPECDAGGPYFVEACPGETAPVALGASATDADGDAVVGYSWSSSCPTASFDDPLRADPLFTLPGADLATCGQVCDLRLEVTDSRGATGSCTTTVSYQDTLPPALVDLGPADGTCLWPPNHRMVCFEDLVSDVVVGDACPDPPSVVVAAVRSDQPEDGSGDGDTMPDTVLLGPAGAATGVCVRAERMGGVRPGRTYSVDLVATDSCGNRATATMTIRVPVDASAKSACGTGRGTGRGGR